MLFIIQVALCLKKRFSEANIPEAYPILHRLTKDCDLQCNLYNIIIFSDLRSTAIKFTPMLSRFELGPKFILHKLIDNAA